MKTSVIGSLILLAVAGSATAAPDRPKKGAAPPPAAASTPAAANTLPQGALRLWRVVTPAAPITAWVEENSIQRRGAATEFWLLIVNAADAPHPSGKPVSAAWSWVEANCADGTQAVRRLTLVDNGGAQINTAVPPTQPQAKPPAGSGLALALARACTASPAADSQPRATTVGMATSWSRNPVAWAAAQRSAATAAAPETATPVAPAYPGSEPAPARTVGLVDMQVQMDGYQDFFAIYAPTQQDRWTDTPWTFLPLPKDRPMDIGGRTVTATGAWFRWTIDCTARKVENSEAHLLLADGTTVRGPIADLKPADATGWQLASIGPARAIGKLHCLDDVDSMSANIKKGLSAREYADARDAVAASRSALQPAPPTIARARECRALARAASALESGLEMWSHIGWSGKLLALDGLAHQIVIAAPDDDAADQAAKSRAAAWANGFADRKVNAATAAALDKCLSDLPIGAQPGQFSRSLAGK